MQRLKPLRKVKPGLRRGEPTPAEKEAARLTCYARAQGFCQMEKHHPRCTHYVPLNGNEFQRGQLAHLKAKRRFGWWESEETGQKWLWASPWCHGLSHQYGPSRTKPVPAKDGNRREGSQ
jgi:hypothetical protein